MTLEERINKDMVEAMKAKDQARLRGLRAIKAAIQLAKTEAKGKAVDEAREMQILQKLVKQRRDSLEIFEKHFHRNPSILLVQVYLKGVDE